MYSNLYIRETYKDETQKGSEVVHPELRKEDTEIGEEGSSQDSEKRKHGEQSLP